jgi:hypothetical protein
MADLPEPHREIEDEDIPSEREQGLNEVALVCSHLAPTQTGEQSPLTSGRRLNPAFVSWLMGAPWWWTKAEPISFGAREMRSYRFALLSRLSILCEGLEY